MHPPAPIEQIAADVLVFVVLWLVLRICAGVVFKRRTRAKWGD